MHTHGSAQLSENIPSHEDVRSTNIIKNNNSGTLESCVRLSIRWRPVGFAIAAEKCCPLQKISSIRDW